MTDFAVMFNWFAVETDEETATCPRCGLEETTKSKNHLVRYCENCKQEMYLERLESVRGKRNTEKIITENEAVNLTFGVIRQAVLDARNGDRDAAQFLVAHDGAELWLKANNIGVTEDLRRKLRLLALGAK